MYEASVTVLLMLPETTVAIERSLKQSKTCPWQCHLRGRLIWLWQCQKKGRGAAQATPAPWPVASGLPSGPGRCLGSLQVGLMLHHPLLCRCYLKQKDALAKNWSPSTSTQHVVCSRRGYSLAGLSPYFLGSQNNFVSFDPLLLPLFREPDRHLATLICGKDFIFFSCCQHNALQIFPSLQ